MVEPDSKRRMLLNREASVSVSRLCPWVLAGRKRFDPNAERKANFCVFWSLHDCRAQNSDPLRASRVRSESGQQEAHAPQQTALWFNHQIRGEPGRSPSPCSGARRRGRLRRERVRRVGMLMNGTLLAEADPIEMEFSPLVQPVS